MCPMYAAVAGYRVYEWENETIRTTASHHSLTALRTGPLGPRAGLA